MKLEINDDDVKGASQDITNCPVARAINRKFNVKTAFAGISFADYYTEDCQITLTLSKELSAQISNWCSNKKFNTGEYDIEQSRS